LKLRKNRHFGLAITLALRQPGEIRMFKIEVVEGGRSHRVVDTDNGVYLEWLVTGSPYSTEVFNLVHPDGGIPFTTDRERGIDTETGLPFFVFKFQTFGSAPRAHINTKHLVYRTFIDDVEKHHWMKVATEALLVFGSSFNGLNTPNPRYVRVDFDGKIYTVEDFGYRLASG
jgi:hypothetical protein